MTAWHCVYGRWLVSPMPLGRNWLRPALWEVLASQDRSLFYWTPLCLLACVGYLYSFRPRRRVADPPAAAAPPAAAPPGLLAAAFLAQVYLLASIRGPQVALGAAYGFRQLTEAVVLLAPGLALLLDRTPAAW